MSSGLTRSGRLIAVPDRFVRQWEAAYREYGNVSELAARSAVVSSETAQSMAAASGAVAVAWRQIGTVRALPWWAVAAVDAAAEAFETQGDEWDARSAEEESTE